MNEILSIVDKQKLAIIFFLIIIVIILIVVVIIYIVNTSKLKKRFNIFMTADQMNLEEIIKDNIKRLDEVEQICKTTSTNNATVMRQLENCIRKVSITRYQAFADIGSDLSFSLAMLDSKNNGVVVTGIYGREDRTVYAKPIDRGVSRYKLTDEELEALSDAMAK